MFRTLVNNSSTHLRRSFCLWKPNVPKHKVALDTQSYRLAHPIWNLKDAEAVDVSHVQPKGVRDWFAFSLMKCLRVSFDTFSGYKPGSMTEALYLRRMIFLETIAGVPGMIGAMVRHLKSLRAMSPDGGWIHHLLEEAENERMHLFTFIKLRNPGLAFRLAVLMSQGIFIVAFSSLYMVSSRTAHRLVGYLEEEAVKTYTNCIKELDDGKLPVWMNMKAPEEAIRYWGLSKDSSFRDVLVAIRADEAMHREVNHHLADLHPESPLESEKYQVVDNMIGQANKQGATPSEK